MEITKFSPSVWENNLVHYYIKIYILFKNKLKFVLTFSGLMVLANENRSCIYYEINLILYLHTQLFKIIN